MRDSLFENPMGDVGNFCFDAQVADVFADMINRSVPGYATVVSICAVLARHFSTPGSGLYDLGCSLGATSYAMASQAADDCRVTAVDSSSPMLQRFRTILDANPAACPIDLVEADICHVEIDHASMVALNYTLQFVAVSRRRALLDSIYRGLQPGGLLVLSEKICLDDPGVDQLFIDLHHDFKRAQGYSDLEISQKRDSIDNVLIPETIDAHKQRLLAAGFSRVEIWFQCFNFVSLVAIK